MIFDGSFVPVRLDVVDSEGGLTESLIKIRVNLLYVHYGIKMPRQGLAAAFLLSKSVVTDSGNRTGLIIFIKRRCRRVC